MRASLVIFAVATALGSTSSGAESQYEWLRGGSVTVAQGRLVLGGADLSDPREIKRAKRLIRREVDRLCAGDGDSPILLVLDERDCRRAAMREAEKDLKRLRALAISKPWQ